MRFINGGITIAKEIGAGQEAEEPKLTDEILNAGELVGIVSATGASPALLHVAESGLSLQNSESFIC